ncbi:DUF2637 domain-containing protein [Nocardia alba]|uniref:Uncharacterized protein DUF2637 n=1 Tax=Nocardia alba TaxID=225051 RepID=A0A4R1FDU1_9NOCA|nr:DUF2637 domain-containing protein [Nocardia alba]TCJ89998.1 uncharacterized protein DUF2637 [Nocardia alba]
MTPAPTTSDQLDSTATAEAIRAARKFWWWVLGASAAISVLGNALHAWTRVEHISDATLPMLHPGVAALLAAVVPIAVLVHTHGLALIVQVPLKHGKLAKAVVFLVILILAVGGFYLSWDALRELAMQAGFAHDEAQLFPLLLDGSIAGATAVLLALPPTPAVLEEHVVLDVAVETDSNANHEPNPVSSAGAVTFVQDEAAKAPPQQQLDVAAVTGGVTAEYRTEPIATADTYRDDFNEEGKQRNLNAALNVAGTLAPCDSTRSPVGRDAGESPKPETEASAAAKWNAVASRLCAGPVSHDPKEVAQILHLAFDQQQGSGDIAVRTGWKEKSVRRLIDDAKPHRMVALAS